MGNVRVMLIKRQVVLSKLFTIISKETNLYKCKWAETEETRESLKHQNTDKSSLFYIHLIDSQILLTTECQQEENCRQNHLKGQIEMKGVWNGKT